MDSQLGTHRLVGNDLEVERLPETIESPRLLIRRWQPEDVDELMAAIAASIEHLRPWMPWIADEPMSRRDRLALIDEWATAWASGGDAVYGAFLRTTVVHGRAPDRPDTELDLGAAPSATGPGAAQGGGAPGRRVEPIGSPAGPGAVEARTEAAWVVVGGCGLHRRLGPGGLEIGYWVHADHARRGYATEMAGAVTRAAFADPDVDRVEIHHDRANDASAGVPRKLGFRYVGYRREERAAPGESGVECAWRTTRPEWFA